MHNIELIKKWRGEICGPHVTFPSTWHKRMYEREAKGRLPQIKRVTKTLWNARGHLKEQFDVA